MRFRLSVALAAAIALVPFFVGAQPGAPGPGETPPRAEVRKALDKVANDPNLATERTANMLRWKEADPDAADAPWMQRLNAIARWFRGLFGWVAESGRLLVFVLGAFAAALLALYIARLVRTRGLPRAPKQFVPPSHVLDLDIRPESLPDDVGAAAFALWESGEQRAALALLYRGMLSRLAHVHAVPIRASSTEGECLGLALPRLAEPSARYASGLVETWAAAVYGGHAPAGAVVQALCGEFAAALDRRSSA